METEQPQQQAQEPAEPGAAGPLPLSPVIHSILVDCDLTPLGPSLCFRCVQATVLQLSSPDGVQNSAVVHCALMNRDIEVLVRRCTGHQPTPSSP